ncbi:peroxiredoxin [Uliginosibacterium sp. H1]|uniref:peroxiredoxin n=1 Tax=Uliginosibacterium sp. H1 TaxID=3114757 RepID=UPI002E197244|nr:peroxiredoxin [Uliginosibacterium sp. H1]
MQSHESRKAASHEEAAPATAAQTRPARSLLSRLGAALVALLPLAAPAATPPVNAPAPAFSLKDQNGATRSLNDFRGKWLVLYFYPKNDTPGCTTEACNFRDGHAMIQSRGAEVIGVSVDDTASHQAFIAKYQLPFPLLADVEGTVAQRYGALSDWKVVKFAKRQTFLIDPQGMLRKAYTSVDPDTHAQQVLQDLDALAKK